MYRTIQQLLQGRIAFGNAAGEIDQRDADRRGIENGAKAAIAGVGAIAREVHEGHVGGRTQKSATAARARGTLRTGV